MTEHAHASPPPPSEPKTPMWLPALGAALFLTAGLVWAATPPPRAPMTDELSDAGAGDASEGGDADTADAAAPDAAPAWVTVPAVPASAVASAMPLKMNRPPPPKVPRPHSKVVPGAPGAAH